MNISSTFFIYLSVRSWVSTSRLDFKSSEISRALILLFASFLAFRILTFADSDSDFANFVSSILLSSVRGGILIRIDSPLLTGLNPRLESVILFSISSIIDFSHGWILIVWAFGVLTEATWFKGV